MLLSIPTACVRNLPSSRSSAAPASVPTRISVDATEALTYPSTISFADGALPELSYREFNLPPGANLTDRTERLAAYALNDPRLWHPVFGLLDLGSGKRRVVLSRGVNENLGYSTLGPRASDSWMAWEEVSPDEDKNPDSTRWFLYAAPIDARALTIGKPVLIDEGVTNYRLRPHYVVLGSKVFWSINSRPGPNQEAFPQSGTIKVRDMSTGGGRTLRGTRTSYPTLCATDGLLSATEVVEVTGRNHARALLIDPDSGGLLMSQDLSNRWRVSHFVRASRDWFAWAVEPAAGAEWPNLYVGRRGEAGVLAAGGGAKEVLMAGIDSIDPTFFGPYMAFESVNATTGRNGSGVVSRARRIWVADPGRRTRSVLLETGVDAGAGWWQTCACAARTQTLLLWNDLGPWIEDQSQAKTLVRLYKLAN